MVQSEQFTPSGEKLPAGQGSHVVSVLLVPWRNRQSWDERHRNPTTSIMNQIHVFIKGVLMHTRTRDLMTFTLPERLNKSCCKWPEEASWSIEIMFTAAVLRRTVAYPRIRRGVCMLNLVKEFRPQRPDWRRPRRCAGHGHEAQTCLSCGQRDQ